MKRQDEPHQRYWFIELISYWEGRINSSHLQAQFAISRQQASSDIKHYCRQQPGNLHYDASRKAFTPQNGFSFAYINGEATEYLSWLDGQSRFARLVDTTLPYESLSLPTRSVSAGLMRNLIQAMREQRAVEVDYVSLKNPDRSGRLIVPHHFVNTGLRWHLRAYCEKSKDYRDFVLSRFRGSGALEEKKSPQGAGQDVAWNTEVTLIFRPDSRLNPAQKAVLINDYHMHDGQLLLKTRGCLVHYLVQQMQVNINMHAENPEAQQLVLANKADVKQWLFE